MKRVFLVVLDSFGCGEAPDAAFFGDTGANTLKSVAGSERFHARNLLEMGLGNISGVCDLPKATRPVAAFGKMRERSMGKDTVIGHWELAGLLSPRPLPTYPAGFPRQVLDAFTQRTGYGVLCNRPYSGTEVIRDYGDEHVRTGKLIVYTSADSVFQIAAHEAVLPPQKLYAVCRQARELLQGEHGVGRVIARPFVGENGRYVRTENRRDFSLLPPEKTLLDAISGQGKDVIAVGKINDIFAGRGITCSCLTHNNREGMEQTMQLAGKSFQGLCFVNLVDFDMLYGHRRDRDGYAGAISEFDAWLTGFLPRLGEEDVLVITADHGCDPCFTASTDHTREYVPLLVWGKRIAPMNLGVRQTFADVAATIARWLDVPFPCEAVSFADETEKA